ncbi:MAG: ribonuclease HII [Methanobrevibacter sp.]|jgi:ribonuclease HII|nr:ribonuclease HII [Candidatus Methanovirga meridionalis]
MKTLGIDEAGRGSVIGSLIVAGVIIPQEKEIMLSRMGVKDSKKLTPQKRKVLARKLKKMFDYNIVEVKAKDIDILRRTITLNNIEEIAVEKIINQLNDHQYDRLILDSFDVKPKRIQKKCMSFLGEKSSEVDVIAEHKADDNYLPVAAAAIIAKERRDEIIDELKKEYRKIGNIGSGYPSDPKTIEFLKKCSYDELPDTVRKSWKTVQTLKNP